MQPRNIRQIALSFRRRCLEAIAQGHRGVLISTIQCPNHVVERDRKDTHRERHDGMNISQWNHGPWREKMHFWRYKAETWKALQIARTTQPVHNMFIWAECLEEDHDTSRNLQEKVQIDGGHVHSDSIHDATHRVLVKEPILIEASGLQAEMLETQGTAPWQFRPVTMGACSSWLMTTLWILAEIRRVKAGISRQLSCFKCQLPNFKIFGVLKVVSKTLGASRNSGSLTLAVHCSILQLLHPTHPKVDGRRQKKKAPAPKYHPA